MYENSRRDRVEVKSAIRTSTSSMIQVYPIWARQESPSICAEPTYLVDNSSGAETFHVLGTCLDDCTDCVEDNGNNDKFNSAEDIGNLCSGRLNERLVSSANLGLETCATYLRGGGDDGPEHIDSCEKTMLTIALSSIGLLQALISVPAVTLVSFRKTDLVCVSDGSIQSIDVGDEENTRKQADAIKKTEVRVNDLNTMDSRTTFAEQLGILNWRSLSVRVLSRVFPGADADWALGNGHD